MLEEEKQKKKITKGGIIGSAIFLVAVIVFGFLIIFFNSKEDTKSYEIKQYNDYLTGLKDYTTNMDRNMSVEDAEIDFLNKVYEYGNLYEDGNGTGYANMVLTNTVIGNDYSDTGSFLDSILDLLNSLIEGGFTSDSDNDITQKVLTLNSYTVCETVGGKYCLEDNGLSAKVYVTSADSNNWAVLLHGVNMNGKQIYNALGKMYTSQGYNVIALDLRGAGDSAGSVAMGYLESLDAYDWIKDLNSNYTRYGVNVKPENIVVHGVSLGGATTLQLATNPDIAAAQGGVYSANLTDLNVKGFVDDCGYTSMSGIITGMLSLGDSSQSNAILGSLGIDANEFINKLEEGIKSLNIGGFTDINIDNITSGKDLKKYLEQFSDKFNDLIEDVKNNEQIIPNQGQVEIPNIDIDTDIDTDSIIDWWNSVTSKKTSYSINDNKASFIANNYGIDTSNLLDNLIKKLLIEIGGIGLTEDNYDKYSNSFSSGRKLPDDSKIVLIHGDNDTMVPPSNADVVANNIGNANLLYKWSVSEAPHAFIVAGMHKNEYSNLISNFADCVANNNCSVFNGAADAPLNSSANQ